MRTDSIEAFVVCSFKERKSLLSMSIFPDELHICAMELASASSMTHGCHFDEPKLIAPRIGIETRRPLLPSCLNSAFELSSDSFSVFGSSGAAEPMLK